MRSWCEIDLSDVEGACREADSAVRFGAVRGVAQAAREGLAEARARRRYRDRTGGLTGKAYARLLVAGGTAPEAELVWPVPYAGFVDAGTSPHTIVPRRGKRLRFVGASGAVVFARAVRHPGTRPDGFAGVAYAKAERVAVREIELAIAQAQLIFAR